MSASSHYPNFIMGRTALLGERKRHENSSWPSYGASCSHLYKPAFCSNMPASDLITHLLRVFILLSNVLSGCVLALNPIWGRITVCFLVSSPQPHLAVKCDLAEGLVWSIFPKLQVSWSYLCSTSPSIYFRFLKIQRTPGSWFPQENGRIHQTVISLGLCFPCHLLQGPHFDDRGWGQQPIC